MRQFIEDITVIVFIIFGILLIVSLIILMVQFILWVLGAFFWVGIGIVSALLMIICVIILRFLPQSE